MTDTFDWDELPPSERDRVKGAVRGLVEGLGGTFVDPDDDTPDEPSGDTP